MVLLAASNEIFFLQFSNFLGPLFKQGWVSLWGIFMVRGSLTVSGSLIGFVLLCLVHTIFCPLFCILYVVCILVYQYGGTVKWRAKTNMSKLSGFSQRPVCAKLQDASRCLKLDFDDFAFIEMLHSRGSGLLALCAGSCFGPHGRVSGLCRVFCVMRRFCWKVPDILQILKTAEAVTTL